MSGFQAASWVEGIRQLSHTAPIDYRNSDNGSSSKAAFAGFEFHHGTIAFNGAGVVWAEVKRN